jgi:hypothetical protein
MAVKGRRSICGRSSRNFSIRRSGNEITDRELREIAHVVGEEARRPLLELIRNLLREMQAAAKDMAELHKELDTVGSDDAPPIAP